MRKICLAMVIMLYWSCTAFALVSTETARNQYSCTDNSSFSYTFRILDDDDIKVIKTTAAGVESVLTKTTHYTVSGVGESGGGTVSLVSACASGYTLTIVRKMTFTQETDYIEGNAFSAETHEQTLDKLTMQTQELEERLDRSLKLPVSSGLSNLDVCVEAGKALGWNSGATAIECITAAADAVEGPASSTDTAVVRWNGTGGGTVQNSGVLIDGSNNVSGVAGLSMGGSITGVVNLTMTGAINGKCNLNAATGDGATDDLAHFQTALACAVALSSASDEGTEVTIDGNGKEYALSDTFTITGVKGTTWQNMTLRAVGGGWTPTKFLMKTSGPTAAGTTIQNVTFDCNKLSSGLSDESTRTLIFNNHVFHMGGSNSIGVHMNGSSGASMTALNHIHQWEYAACDPLGICTGNVDHTTEAACEGDGHTWNRYGSYAECIGAGGAWSGDTEFGDSANFTATGLKISRADTKHYQNRINYNLYNVYCDENCGTTLLHDVHLFAGGIGSDKTECTTNILVHEDGGGLHVEDSYIGMGWIDLYSYSNTFHDIKSLSALDDCDHTEFVRVFATENNANSYGMDIGSWQYQSGDLRSGSVKPMVFKGSCSNTLYNADQTTCENNAGTWYTWEASGLSFTIPNLGLKQARIQNDTMLLKTYDNTDPLLLLHSPSTTQANNKQLCVSDAHTGVCSDETYITQSDCETNTETWTPSLTNQGCVVSNGNWLQMDHFRLKAGPPIANDACSIRNGESVYGSEGACTGAGGAWGTTEALTAFRHCGTFFNYNRNSANMTIVLPNNAPYGCIIQASNRTVALTEGVMTFTAETGATIASIGKSAPFTTGAGSVVTWMVVSNDDNVSAEWVEVKSQDWWTQSEGEDAISAHSSLSTGVHGVTGETNSIAGTLDETFTGTTTMATAKATAIVNASLVTTTGGCAAGGDGTEDINMDSGNKQKISLGKSCTITINGFTGSVVGNLLLEIYQDGAGSWVPTISGITWIGDAPTLTAAAGTTTIISCFDDSTTIYCTGTGEADPQVGTLTSGKVCTGQTDHLDCATDTDGSGDCASGTFCLGDHTHSSYAPLTGASLVTPSIGVATGTSLALTGSITGTAPPVILTHASGVHDGSDDQAIMTDSGESFTSNVMVGMTVYNVTDGSSCTITANATTTISCTLSGGAQNDWDTNDVWQVGPGPAQSGSVFYVSLASTIRHPAISGYIASYYVTGAVVLTIEVTDAMTIIGATASAIDAGDTIDSAGAAGNFIVLHNGSATSAYGWGRSGTWVDGGAT